MKTSAETTLPLTAFLKQDLTKIFLVSFTAGLMSSDRYDVYKNIECINLIG